MALVKQGRVLRNVLCFGLLCVLALYTQRVILHLFCRAST